jgi:hypothetical protein
VQLRTANREAARDAFFSLLRDAQAASNALQPVAAAADGALNRARCMLLLCCCWAAVDLPCHMWCMTPVCQLAGEGARARGESKSNKQQTTAKGSTQNHQKSKASDCPVEMYHLFETRYFVGRQVLAASRVRCNNPKP